MSKLFEDTGKNKRKWGCFVCGRNYDNFADYKDHIGTEHEEGREYITCPACKAPVRDLKLHFKAKHPNRLMPKNSQTRVATWFDFKPGKDGKKRRQTKKPKFRTGFFESKKNGCEIFYRSGLEEKFYNLLEQDNDVIGFCAEPFKVPYFWQGKWHDYVPDLRVNYIDSSTEIWEIKPATQTTYDQNQAKWASMNDHAINMGWNFVVQTEVGLGKLERKISKQQKNRP